MTLVNQMYVDRLVLTEKGKLPLVASKESNNGLSVFCFSCAGIPIELVDTSVKNLMICIL